MLLVPLLRRFRCLHDCNFLKTLETMEGFGVSLEENKFDEPMQIDQAVTGSTCTAESCTHLTLRLYTRVGPILIRGVRVLVILEGMPAIFVARDLLKALRIYPHEILMTKLSEGLIPPKLDFSEQV